VDAASNGKQTTQARASRTQPRRWHALLTLALAAATTMLVAHPFPPYWNGGSGTAIHFQPVPWPATNDWTAYTKLADDIEDRANSDDSNGGTSPQSYVNVSSGCTDETLPSVYYAYDAANQVLFFRWRVQAGPHNFATGPNPGTAGATSPWNSALWTVFIDTNGDGFRDFAVHLDGSSGGPATSIDRVAAIWSNTRSQSLDYVNDPRIHLIGHNPTAFVDGPGLSDRLLNFQSTLTPTAAWPNGAAETVWDYGTTRATKLNTGCGEHFIDYQIPLAMLDATAVGGPKVTPSTPMSLFFATANSLNNPLQKDVVVSGDFVADPSRPVPGGDTITPLGGTIQQPTIQSLAVSGCGPTRLSAVVGDTINDDGSTSVDSVTFYRYYDANGNGLADDGGTWTSSASGVHSSTTHGLWTANWHGATEPGGAYLWTVLAQDQQGNTTHGHLTAGDLGGAPDFPNPTGVIIVAAANACGTGGPTITTQVSPSTVAAGQTVTITITVDNPGGTALPLASLANALPAGFAYANTTGGTLSPATLPTNGDTGSIAWTFAPGTTVSAGGSATLEFTATAGPTAGVYSTTSSANAGALVSGPAEVSVGAPALTITKTASVSSAAPGDTVVYTLAVSNDSSVGVTNATVTDVLPDGLDYVSATGSSSYNSSNRTVTWLLGDIGAGAGPVTVTLTTTVTSPYPVSALTPVVNTASVTSDQTGATGASSAVYVDAPRARLSVQLEAASTLVAWNTTLTYTVRYANIGQLAASNATLTLPIPTGWSFVSAADGGTNVAGTVTWSLGSLAAGASGTTTVTLRTGPAAYTGSNPSTATASLAATGVTPANDPFTVAITGLGDVCSTYYFRDTQVNVGTAGNQRIANTVPVTALETGQTVTGTSPGSATEIQLADFFQDPPTASEVSFNGTLSSSMWVLRSGGPQAVLSGFVYDHDPATGAETLLGSGSSSFNGNSLTLFSFDVPVSGTLAAGHRLRWRYSFHSNNVNTGVDLSLLFGGTASAGLRDSRSSFCVTAPATPALDVQVSQLVAVAGDTLTYTVPFGNAGVTNMTASQLVMTLPAGVSFTSATLNGVSATPSSAGQQHTFAVNSSAAAAGTIAGGGAGTLVLVGTISQPFTGGGTTLTATAALSSAQTTAVIDAATTTLLTPSTSLSKSVSDSLLVPGDTVTYTLDVLNAGPGSASAVTVTDVLPVAAWFTYVPGSARLNGTPIAPDPVTAGTLTYDLGTLAAAGTARITFQMAVAASGVPAGLTPRANTATVSDLDTAGQRTSNTVTTTVSTSPNLQLTKTSAPSSGPVDPGTTITYTLTLTNTGGAPATGVRLIDDIPTLATYVAGTMAEGAALTDAIDGDLARHDASGPRVVFEIGTLAPGESRAFTYDVVVLASLPAGSSVVSASALATATNAPSRTASASLNAAAEAQITLLKSAPASAPFPTTTITSVQDATTFTVASTVGLGVGTPVRINGVSTTITSVAGNTVQVAAPVTAADGDGVVTTIQYVLELANTGNADATSVQVTDEFSPTMVLEDGNGAPAFATGNEITFNIGTLPAGASRTLRIRVFPTAPGSFDNTAVATADSLSPTTSNTVTTGVGVVRVTKSTSTPAGTSVDGKTLVTYEIVLANQNPSVAADNVAVTDNLATGFSYVSTTAITGATAATSPAAGATTPTWTGLTVPAGGSVTLTFVAQIDNVGPGTYQNAVQVSSTSLGIGQFDELSTTSEDVTVAAALGTTGVPEITAIIAPGGTLTLRVTDRDLDTDPAAANTVVVTVTNPRTSEADTVTLTETGPATGIFEATMATVDSVTAGSNDAGGPLNAANGDQPLLTYADAFDGTGAARSATASSSVVSANNNPTANDDTFTVTEDAVATPVDVLANDSTAPDTGETLTVTAVTQGSQGGTVTLVAGVVSYQPAPDVFGTETFTYTVSDGNGGTDTATVTMTVTAQNDPPTANDDGFTVAEDAAAAPVAVLTNDAFAPDTGETLTVTAVTQGSQGGTVTLVAGVVSYQPAPNFSGSETFTYTISDGNGGTDTATVTMTVTEVNDPPSAADDTASVSRNSAATPITVLANDSFAPDTIDYLFIYDVSAGSAGGTIHIISCGTMLEYTPAPGFTGTETFTYEVRDSAGASAFATVTVTVTGGNNNPTATPDTATVAEDAGATPIDVLANDSTAPDPSETLTVTVVTQGSQGGTVVITGGGTGVTYQPAPNFEGTETFTYTVSDGNGGSSTTAVTVTVTGVNDAPTGAPDTASIDRDAAATPIDVLANDSSAPDAGETLAITAVTQGTQGGTIVITGGGTGLTYQPAPGFEGTETFTYTLGDGNGGTATIAVTVTVSGPAYRRYFSEGLNNANVATHISLANPATEARPVHLEFYRQNGPSIVHDLTLGPRSRATIDTRTIPGLADAPFGTAIESAATVVAERSMTWDYGDAGASLEHAVEASTTWYFAEGATTGRFQLFYLLLNPNGQPATATLNFLPQVGPPVSRVYTIPARTRLTVPVNSVDPTLASADLGAAVTSDLPVVVERSMYLSSPTQPWIAGTTGAGVRQPLTRWVFGEGAVGPFFDAWILLANPGTTPSTVEVHYISENGGEEVTTHTVPVGRRITIRVADDVPQLFASSFGVVVNSTNAVPFIAERAMWWPNDGSGWYEGHVGTGLPGTGQAWGVADGIVTDNPGSEDYVLVANTSTTAGILKVTTVFDDGTAPIERILPIGPLVRSTFRMRTFQPEVVGKRFSVFVESIGANPVDLVVEHSNYWNTTHFWGAGSSAPGSPIR
jgi:uncharacterized repeat protein (TIGR01451 family)